MKLNRAILISALVLAPIPWARPALPGDEPAAEGVVRLGNLICPVKGTPVDPKFTTTWKGTEIGFSCAACVTTFLADPLAYMPALLHDLGTQLTDARGRLAKYEPAAPKPPDGPIAPPALTPYVDGVLATYLDLTRTLAADDDTGSSSAASAFVEKAKALEEAAKGSARGALATAVREKAAAIATGPIATRRKGLPNVGIAVIALIDAAPPSSAVEGPLFVVHCPMFPGDWIQRGEVVANPFYGAAMAKCGSVVRKIAASAK